MDLETLKKLIPELINLLEPELKGTQKFVFSALLDHINKVVGFQEAQIIPLKNKVAELEAKLAAATPADEPAAH